jgi:hypothetical protein
MNEDNPLVEHTTGPWRVDRYGSVLDGNHERLLANVAFPTGNHPKAKEIAANTHLIAAAPELLWICERLAEDLEDGHWSNTKEHLRQLVRKARGANP